MAEMIKSKTVKAKKKGRQKPEENIENSIPDVPKLEDFVGTVCQENTSNGITDDPKNYKLIENEIKDAVEDNAAENDKTAEREDRKEEVIHIPLCADDVDNLSMSDVKIDINPAQSVCFQNLQKIDHVTVEDLCTSSTEMKEMHSYSINVDVIEADTRLESPLHVAESKCSNQIANNHLQPSAPVCDSDKSQYPVLEEKTVAPTAPVMTSVVKKNIPIRADFAQPSCSRVEPTFQDYSQEVAEEFKPLSEVQLLALYNNSELESNIDFVSEFVENQLQGIKQQHHLYELLVSYLRARNRLIVNSMELQSLKKECKEHQSCLWTIETSVVSESGECQDGNPVSASHEYKVSYFNKNALASLQRTLTAIKDLVNEVQSLNSYSSEVLRLQIEHYVQSVAYSCPEFANLPHNAPVNLIPGDPPIHVLPHMMELRTCISILFTFQRRVVKDVQFVSDTRDWLSRLTAILLRVASWKDHLFLLHHALRCPAGVGSWASFLIQPPPPIILPANRALHEASPFTNPNLDHIIASLATILLPVREREHFLEQVQSSLRDSVIRESENDSLWVLIDSEGEEDEDISKSCWSILKENDLVALINQIPFDYMFRHVLLVDHRNDRDIYEITRVNENHILRLFAFSTVLVRLLRQGLRTYDTPRYRQFAKRLGRLIRHTVQYASDHWECFRCNRWVEPAMLQRLQVEYDAFFLRATRCIFSSQRLGAWQFLAVVPYNVVSISTLWRLFYILHEDYQEEENLSLHWDVRQDWERKLNDPELRIQFEEKLTTMPEAESYYLLTTFANMAMARGSSDRDFVKAATLDLFQIGFLSSATQESCSKTARVLLANITTKHPSLLSDILAKLLDNFTQAGKLSLYLFKELPLRLWNPSDRDLSTISNWLLNCPLVSTENNLARLILSNLNWGCTEQALCLELSFHRRVAALVVEAALKFVPEAMGSGGTAMITESVKQVSNLASSIVRPQSTEQVFSQWAWDMLTRLRLHALDQPDHAVWTAMANPGTVFSGVPDIEIDQTLESIVTGVRDRQPIACYAAALMSIWGHSVPLLCTKGFNMLQILLCHYKYDAVLGVLQHFVPLFLDCEESLVKNERFVSILISVLMADKTYMKMAKNLIAPEFPGPVLRQFGNMIEYQMEHFRRYSLNSPRPFIQLWMVSLSQISDWSKENGIIYLMDVMLRCAFFHLEARETASFLLNKMYQTMSSPKHGSSFSSFISWVASGTANVVSLLPRTSIPECPWYAYFVLEMEQELQEEKTGLWREVLKELAAATGKANVDQAVKRAAQSLKLPAPSASCLFIYRWAQQALDTPLDHPLLVLMWQKFFVLFLARVPSVSGVPDRGCMGDKFFEGMLNLSFHKKLKKRLQEASEYYRCKSTETTGDSPQAEEAKECQSESEDDVTKRKEWFATCSKLLKTFSLWLEEPRLQEPSLFLPALPPQYNPTKLAGIIQGDKSPWLDYLDFPAVRESQQKAAWDWQVARYRTHDPSVKVLLPSPEEIDEPANRILKRLQSYDSAVPPPPLRPSKPVVPTVSNDMLYNRGTMLNGLKPYFRSLLEYAQIYSLRMSEHTALDCNFLELVPALYRDVEMEIILHAACDSEPQMSRRDAALTCAGPAAIRLKVCEARVSEGTEHLIQLNRGEYETVLTRATQPPPQKVCVGSVFLEHTIMLLENEYMQHRTKNNTETVLRLQDVGVTLFYHMIGLYNEDAAFYPPTKQLLTSCLERLGLSFVSGDESQCMRLLTTIIQQPQMGGILGPHFTPAAASTPTFLQMYQTVVSIMDQQAPERIFVLLSKFDVPRWLVSRRPRLSERSQFIELVGNALTTAGLNPEEEKLILHEVFRKHLRFLLMYDFPEHYGEILNLALRSSETQCLATDVWFDILNALVSGGETSQKRLKQGQNLGKIKEEIRRYATEQNLLTHSELRETASLLASHFMKERLQYGLYGLYPKYRIYIEPLTTFLGMIGHALVVSTLQHDRGTLSDKLCEQLWPSLCDMFSPWLTPYWTKNLKEPTAAWIQQLTDDRSVLLPWITADAPHAQRMVAMFVECVRFILDTLPACSNILCFLWQMYVSSFAHSAVKDYILNIIHSNLQSLPWDRFWPSMQDLELMLKVVDQYLPDCHSFLGAVFIEVPWWNWVGHVLNSYSTTVSTRSHVCLLHLLVKLASEPTVRQSPKVIPLLQEAQKFAWHLIDSSAYEPVINWCVMSADPRVILSLESEESNPTDNAVLELLQIVAAYIPTSTHFHSTTLKKRQMFVRACVKLLISCASRFSALLKKKEVLFRAAIHKILDDVETVVSASVPLLQQVPEAGLLLSEILVIVNQSPTSHLAALTVDSCALWLARRDSASIVLQGFLCVLGTSLTVSDALGTILEGALQSFFKKSVSQMTPPTWQQAIAILQPVVPRQPPIEDVFLGNGNVLSLYALLLKRLPMCRDIREEANVLDTLVDWLSSIKATEALESKLPLLWSKVLALSLRQCELSGDTGMAVKSLRKLVQILMPLAEDRSSGGWGILGAIGLRKQSPVSVKCRLLARITAVYVLAQLPEGDANLVRTSSNAPGGLSNTNSPIRPNAPECALPTPSADALKSLSTLEALATNKNYVELKTCLDVGVKYIVDPANSLHNASHILGVLANELYQHQYLLGLKVL